MPIRPCDLTPLRHSILLALGVALAPGCGGKGGDDDGTAGSTSEGTTSAGSTSEGTSEGSTSEGSTSEGSTTEETTGLTPINCEGSEPIPQAHVEPSAPSGFERCEDGTIHRVLPVDCLAPATPSTCMDSSGGGCQSDADCVAFPHGACHQDVSFGGALEGGTCSCVYGCVSDSDCGAGEICRCAGDGLGWYTECVQGGCVEDSECGEFLCALSPDTCEPGGFLTACHGPTDECYGNDTCGDQCVFQASPEPKWVCNGAVCGRPFLVDEAARVAPVIGGGTWSKGQGPGPEMAGLGAQARAALRDHWAKAAAMEHASVASFARFVLDLLGLGAPPELVLAAQEALKDEVEHARACFALASAYAGEALGPGPLATAGALSGVDRQTVARAVLREACVGETLAAIEAQAAAAAAKDPAVRRVLQKIAADEGRHAALGWQALAWLMAEMDPAARAGLLRELEAALAELTMAPPAEAAPAAGGEAQALAGHGLMSEAARAAALRIGAATVLAPAAAALARRGLQAA